MRLPTTHRRESVWDFMNEMERAFDDFWKAPSQAAPFTPAIDLKESETDYTISVDLPGVDEKDIKIDVHGGRLSISGERVREEKSEGEGYRRVERSFGRFERAFQLPQNVDEGAIKAKFANGVLDVTVPKKESAKPRTIAIEAKSH